MSIHSLYYEKRNFFRVQPSYPLSATLTIGSVNGVRVKFGRTHVLIENISAGGLCFITKLKLPIHPEVMFEFGTRILHEPLFLTGRIIRMIRRNEGFYEYGVEFNIPSREMESLSSIVNRLYFKLNYKKTVEGTSFYLDDYFDFLDKEFKE